MSSQTAVDISPVFRKVATPMSEVQQRQKSVVVHSGARDGYQLARALSEAGMLDTLVTDLYWPSDRKWAKSLSRVLPARLLGLMKQRSEPHVKFLEKAHQFNPIGGRSRK